MPRRNWEFMRYLTGATTDRFMNDKDILVSAFQVFCNEPYRNSTRLQLAIEAMNKDLPRARQHKASNQKSRLLAFRLVGEGRIII